jgi:hypothetical protein
MNNIDFDAQTQLKHPGVSVWRKEPITQFVPFGYCFPMCSMNLAFRREVTPLMYFPLMGRDPGGRPWGYDRFDDIWAGIFAKKICDHLGLAVVNGSPFVEHRRASDPEKNLIKEKRGLHTNETLWAAIGAAVLRGKTPLVCYEELSRLTPFPQNGYFRRLKQAMDIWITLYP